MDDLGSLTSQENTALVILAFLQVDCYVRNKAFCKELLTLGNDLNLTRDINCNDRRVEALDDGDLETDGHLSTCISGFLDDIQPSVELQWPRNHEEAAALQQIAEELREIAAQLEHNVVAQATQNLARNVSASRSEWMNLLTGQVEWVMRQGVGLDHLPQERVIVALTLTLVKGVCEYFPQLLRNLFYTALQFIRSSRPM